MDRRAFLLLTLAGCADPQIEPNLSAVMGTPATPPPPKPSPPVPVPVVSGDPNFDAWLAAFKPKAQAAGLSYGFLESELAGLSPDPKVSVLDGKQPEFSKPVGDYVKGTVSDARVVQGRQFRGTLPYLPSLERQYGVPREIVLAIWAMESAFGKIQGDMDVVRSLATLAAEGRRRAWGESELISALKIIASGQQSRAGLKGSWAGAMGQTQFLPSVYLSTAIDGDADGRRDIWGSTADALASTANYLRKNGWTPGLTWGYEVVAPTGARAGQTMSLGQWQAAGARRTNGQSFPSAGVRATLLTPGGPTGPAFLMTNNFRVIKRYNNADSYALAVGHLGDRIRGGAPFVTEWPNHDKPLDEDGRRELQALLARKGFDVGEPDGKIGMGTRTAIISFQKAQGLLPDGYASVSLLRRLKGAR